MEDPIGKIMSPNICCFGINNIGVPVAAVFAHTCPYINVAVVDLNFEKVTSWNTKQINMREQGLEEILKKCQNRNLVFTTEIEKVVKLSEIIFICLSTSPNSIKNTEGGVGDLTDLEKAIKFIAQVSENNKIIVIKSTVPIGTNETVKRILKAHKQNNIKFQVLSIPVFISSGNAVSSLMKPERVLIGSDLTKEGLEAAQTLKAIYSQWVPKDRILTMNNWSAEISRISQNAFLAQRLTSLSTWSMISEELGGDITQIAKVMKEFSSIGPNYLEPTFGFGGPHLKSNLKSLIYMCERLNLKEPAEYWKEVLLLNEYHKKKFTTKIIFTYFNTLRCEKICVWGIGFKKNVEFLQESLGIEMCLNFLEEGARLSIYDTIEKRQVMEELNSAGEKRGFDKSLLKEVNYYEDPYKATYKTNAIVVCNQMEEFDKIDFNLIYKDMIKPPHIFDGRKCLPHEKLMQIGFIIKTIGKKFD